MQSSRYNFVEIICSGTNIHTLTIRYFVYLVYLGSFFGQSEIKWKSKQLN